MMLGGGKRGVEEARLAAGKVEVRGADGAEPESCARRRMRSRAHLVHAIAHAVSESSDRFVADRRKEGLAVGEVSVGGIRNHPDHARHLAQHDRVRPA